jgi:histidinol phosphatase-like PHP family hydrolase
MASVLKQETIEDRIARLMVGAIDLHCHSGPSVMARDLNHVEAMEEAAAAGFRGMLIKDHYYSATPIVRLLQQTHGHLGVQLFSGVPLNNSNGGFNKHAVDAGCSLGADLVWMPTFSAKNHMDSPFGTKAGFPHTIKPMLPLEPLTPIDENGEVKDEVKEILDLVAQYNVILSGGHMHISEIFKVFEEARKRGVKKLLVNHPTFILEATHEDIRQLVAQLDAYIEHSLCMYIPLSHRAKALYPPEELDALIKAGTVDRTILASDMGQKGLDHPVVGFHNVIAECIGLDYSDEDIRKMVAGNALRLLGIEE